MKMITQLARYALIVALFFLFHFYSRVVFAQEKFEIANNSTYTVSDIGVTTVVQKTTITNKTEFYYTPSYTINLGLKDISNIRVYNTSGALPFVVNNNDEGKNIEITFDKRVVGLNESNSFTFSFDTPELARKFGSIWEVSIPGIANLSNFDTYALTLTVPQSFGNPEVIKPPKSIVSQGNSYTFSKEDVGESGVFMLFGTAQFYNFHLTYHIANSNLFPVQTEIALPPNTSYQEVIIKNISEKPIRMYQDDDGNWLAVYNLAPNKKKDITANVLVKVSSIPQEEGLTNSSEYSKRDEYWEVTDPSIKKIADTLSGPQDIYDYVVKTLSYDYEKVTEKNDRVGAKKVLVRPSYAVCLEFTDLFVALARAKGIPTRAVEGYAYTENSKLRPLSLLKDVLHAWPEYYDDKKRTWVMVDPTWGNTTKGMDYFNTLDFNHIAFVIKGENSSYPVPAGGYKFNSNSKDVHVSFIKAEEFIPFSKSTIFVSFPVFALTGFPIKGSIEIENTGNMENKSKNVSVQSELDPHSQIFQTGQLLPYEKKIIPVEFKKLPLFASRTFLSPTLTTGTYNVTILFEGKSISKTIEVGLLPKNILLLVGGGIFVASIILFIIAYKVWRLLIQRQKG